MSGYDKTTNQQDAYKKYVTAAQQAHNSGSQQDQHAAHAAQDAYRMTHASQDTHKKVMGGDQHPNDTTQH